MQYSEISNTRLANQGVEPVVFKTAKEVVSWMGAVQAQDLGMVKWAVGIRTQNTTVLDFDDAFNRGEIIRTHLMRPTWHLVSADDIYWLLELTAPRIKSGMKSRHRELELTEDIISMANRIIGKVLMEKSYASREELATKFQQAGIRTNENRLSHILFCAELDGLICSGPANGNKQTYSLLSKRVPNKRALTKEESLAELAKRYFISHGPATLKDFAWWSGLSLTEAKKAVDFVKTGFFSETTGSETYWFPNSFSGLKQKGTGLHLLPAYDEFLISYTNRSASISKVDNPKAISNNGIFRPIIVANGQVAGTWKRTIKKETIIVEPEFFTPCDPLIKLQFEDAAKRYVRFLGKE
jgi:hypothetical protein